MSLNPLRVIGDKNLDLARVVKGDKVVGPAVVKNNEPRTALDGFSAEDGFRQAGRLRTGIRHICRIWDKLSNVSGGEDSKIQTSGTRWCAR